VVDWNVSGAGSVGGAEVGRNVRAELGVNVR